MKKIKLKPKTHGEKIRDTKKMKREAANQISIGDLVSEKYYPKSVGLVLKGPFVVKDRRWNSTLKDYIQTTHMAYKVAWMQHPKMEDCYLNVPMQYRLYEIKLADEKKVLERPK